MADVPLPVSERQNTSDQVHADERLHTAVENLLDPFAILTPVRDRSGAIIDFVYDYINAAGRAAYGKTRAELVGHSLMDSRPGLRESGLLAAYADVIDTGKPLLKEGFYYRSPGDKPDLVTLDVRATRVGDQLALYWRDITEQKRAEAERAIRVRDDAARATAEAARERFAFLAEASTVLASSLDYETTLTNLARLAVPRVADWCTIDIVGDDGTVRLVSLAHVDPAKVQWAEELRRRYPIDMNAPYGVPNVLRSGQPELYPSISDEMLVASAHNEEELSILRQVGYRAIMVVPLKVVDKTIGAISYVVAESQRTYGQDDLDLATNLARHAALAIDNARLYQEIQHLNEGLQQRAVSLEEANRELQAFAYSISHDLRAPLRAVDGFSRILIDEHSAELSPEARRYLQMVAENAQQMGRLIDDLLEFARLGRQSLKKERVKPADIVHEVLADLQSATEGRTVEVSVADLPSCRADRALLRQVWSNLLTNAFKFTATRPVARIEVGAISSDGPTVYYVKDNGVGFDMAYAKKLFGVFQRLHRADEFPGTGVGLAIVQRIVQKHGGRVWGEGVVDEGATFYFTLQGESSSD